MRGSNVWENSWNVEPEGSSLSWWSSPFTSEMMMSSYLMASNKSIPSTLLRNSVKRFSFEVSDGSSVEMSEDFPVLFEKWNHFSLESQKLLDDYSSQVGVASFDESSTGLDWFPVRWSAWVSRFKSPALIRSLSPFDWSFFEFSACNTGRWLGEVTSWFSGEGLDSTSASSSTMGDAARRSVDGSYSCWDVSAFLCSILWLEICLDIKMYFWHKINESKSTRIKCSSIITLETLSPSQD